MTISDYVISEFNQHAFDTANSLGGLDPNQLYPLGTNDQYDAYRHALISAELTRFFGETRSKKMMDDHEAENPNSPNINSMDRWNNNVGREEYKKWIAAKDAGQTNDTLGTVATATTPTNTSPATASTKSTTPTSKAQSSQTAHNSAVARNTATTAATSTANTCMSKPETISS